MAEGAQGILILLYSCCNEQAIRVCEKPTEGGAHACVVGDDNEPIPNVYLVQG